MILHLGVHLILVHRQRNANRTIWFRAIGLEPDMNQDVWLSSIYGSIGQWPRVQQILRSLRTSSKSAGFELEKLAENQSAQGAVVEIGTLAISQSGHHCTELNSFSASFSCHQSL
jgi:hypothetical protein